jgi:flagellar protein FliS
MVNQPTLNGYQQNHVTHISLEKLVVLLYEGAIAFTKQAQELFRNDDQVNGGIKLLRGRNIVSELRNGLDYEQGGELAQNLERLYTYVHDEMIRTANEGNPALLDSVIEVLTTLKEGWQVVNQKTGGKSPIETQQPQNNSYGLPPANSPTRESRGLSMKV